MTAVARIRRPRGTLALLDHRGAHSSPARHILSPLPGLSLPTPSRRISDISGMSIAVEVFTPRWALLRCGEAFTPRWARSRRGGSFTPRRELYAALGAFTPW
ncbi:hypothetical protein ACQP2P_01350 [Dactylosporangium sp. CA-139114]|uniref:hypothetical protein n=1 Tax=Dactylosporangium sp. CA-139114 TaxID=3239931 RepID=UPI003D955B87